MECLGIVLSNSHVLLMCGCARLPACEWFSWGPCPCTVWASDFAARAKNGLPGLIGVVHVLIGADGEVGNLCRSCFDAFEITVGGPVGGRIHRKDPKSNAPAVPKGCL